MKIKNLADKITVAVVYMLVVEICVSLALAINFMYDYHFYSSDNLIYPLEKAMSLKTEKEYDHIANFIAISLKKEAGNTLTENEEAAYENLVAQYKAENTNLVFEACDSDGNVLCKNADKPTEVCYSNTSAFSVYVEGKGVITGTLNINIRSESEMTVQDGYQLAVKMIHFAHSVRYFIFFLLFVAMCLAVFLLGLLMSSIGKENNVAGQKKHLYFIDRIPFDLLSLIAILLIGFILIMIVLTSAADIKEVSVVLWNVVILILTFVISLILLMYCITLATRIKIGHIMQNTLIYMLISKVRKKVKNDDKGYFKVPLLGKTLISIGIIMLLELGLIFYFVFKYKTCLSGRLADFKFLYFAFGQVTVLFVLGALFFMIVFNLNRVRESGQKIASGDFDSVADSHIMFGDFKAINDDLITIKDDMIHALEEQNKSRKMRSELITNISHDIKTPLTSIVNYANIISSGKCTEEETKAYSEIISRQSAKLNDLLFNLVEVSKISTGALKVEFDSINVALFLSQTIEEFRLKFSEKSLVIEENMPEEDLYIRADGMILWRVFENLFSNILKYAMPGSRVLLSVEKADEKVKIILRNISERTISSTAEELLMRFKRDDSSRHTEGNGLGLSIAKSFTEVQQGTFEIFVDGDLFKTVISFDEYKIEQ